MVLLNQKLVIVTPNAPNVDSPITLEPLGGARFRLGSGSASFATGRETLVGLRFRGSTATSSDAPQSFAPRLRR